MEYNDLSVLIAGFPAGGKTRSLFNIRDKENWMYLNCEPKRKSFRAKPDFQEYKILDPQQVLDAIEFATTDVSIQGVIIDSLTFLLDMYESLNVVGAADGRAAWQMYQQYLKNLMQQYVPAMGKTIIFTAHLLDVLDEKNMVMNTVVPVKGASKNNGVESFFSTVVLARKITIKELEKTPYDKNFITISAEDRKQGFKHVFQTRNTSDTMNYRIRCPDGLFTSEQTYMDNDVQLLLDYLTEYYK